MHWLSLTLICAFALASSDAAAKRWLGGYGARELAMARLGLAGLLLLPLVFHRPLPTLPLDFWLWMAFLLPLEIAAMLLYMKAIRDFPLALTLPYLAFTPVIITFVGWLVLGETVNAQGFAGILLVVAGAWVLNLEQAPDAATRFGLLRPFAAILRNPGSRLMLGTAVIYALTAVGGKAAMQYMPPEQFGPFYFTCVGLGTLLLFGRGRMSALWRRPLPTLLVAVLMAVMVVAHFLALSQVETAYMISVKRTSLLFGILYGALFFGERHLGANLFAGGMMVGGVALIALA